MEEKLHALMQDVFNPEFLEVINTSHHHAGHSGSPGTGQSHFTVRMRATTLQGLARLAAHRRVMEAAAPLFQEGLHALSIEIL
ncbi:MAG: BolA family transcriptional regulator [Candidatus Puniceispirillum sp.]|nr:BolA family transcriptional regulator [Candidatus Puniceispirillum sp.]